MKPILRGKLVQRDNLEDLALFKPSGDNFCVEVEACIGNQENDFSNTYWFKVCSAEWIKNEVINNGKPILGRGLMIVDSYSVTAIQFRFNEILASIEARNWEELTIELSKYIFWEFD